MVYGKEGVVKFLGQLLVDRRLTLAQYDALRAAKFIDDPAVYAQIIQVRGREEVTVMLSIDTAFYAPLSATLLPVKES